MTTENTETKKIYWDTYESISLSTDKNLRMRDEVVVDKKNKIRTLEKAVTLKLLSKEKSDELIRFINADPNTYIELFYIHEAQVPSGICVCSFNQDKQNMLLEDYENNQLINSDAKNRGPNIVYMGHSKNYRNEHIDMQHSVLKNRLFHLDVPYAYRQATDEEEIKTLLKNGYHFLKQDDDGTYHFRADTRNYNYKYQLAISGNNLYSHFSHDEFVTNTYPRVTEEYKKYSKLSQPISERPSNNLERFSNLTLDSILIKINEEENLDSNFFALLSEWIQTQLTEDKDANLDQERIFKIISALQKQSKNKEAQKIFNILLEQLYIRLLFLNSSKIDEWKLVRDGLKRLIILFDLAKKYNCTNFLKLAKNKSKLFSLKKVIKGEDGAYYELSELYFFIGEDEFASELLIKPTLYAAISEKAEYEKYSVAELKDSATLQNIFIRKISIALHSGKLETAKKYILTLEESFPPENLAIYDEETIESMFLFLDLLKKYEYLNIFTHNFEYHSKSLLNSFKKFIETNRDFSRPNEQEAKRSLLLWVKIANDHRYDNFTKTLIESLKNRWESITNAKYIRKGKEIILKLYLTLNDNDKAISELNDILATRIKGRRTNWDNKIQEYVAEELLKSGDIRGFSILIKTDHQSIDGQNILIDSYPELIDELKNVTSLFDNTQWTRTVKEKHLSALDILHPEKAEEKYLEALLNSDIDETKWWKIFTHLTHVLYGTSIQTIRFWIKTGLFKDKKEYQSIFTNMQLIQKITQSNIGLFMGMGDDQYDNVILNLCKKRVLTDPKKIIYLSLQDFTNIDIFLESRIGDEKLESSAIKLVRTIINQFPIYSIGQTLFCLNQSTVTTKQSLKEKPESLETIDWSNKEEQETLYKALRELGGISPTIYKIFRKIWLLNSKKQKSIKTLLKEAKILHTRRIQKMSDKLIIARTKNYSKKQILEMEDDLKAAETRKEKVLEDIEKPLKNFISLIVELKESFHQNLPLDTMKTKIAVLTKIDNLDDDDQIINIYSELIILLYKPVGMGIEEVKEHVKKLLEEEKDLINQVNNSSIVWSPDENIQVHNTIDDDLNWDKDKKCYSSQLISATYKYEILKENSASYQESLEKLREIVESIPKTIKSKLINKGKSLKPLADFLQKSNTAPRMLKKLYILLLEQQETFGIWLDDNLNKLSDNPEEMKIIRQIRNELQKKISEIISNITISKISASDKKRDVDIYLSKNVASFFAKATVGLCTSEDINLFLRKDHFHINIVDHKTQDVLANLQLYIMPATQLPEENRGEFQQCILIRGLNPGEKYISRENSESWQKIFFEIAKRISIQSNLGGPYIVEKHGWHPHTNRPEMDISLSSFYAKSTPIKLKKPFYITEYTTGDTLGDIATQAVYEIS